MIPGATSYFLSDDVVSSSSLDPTPPPSDNSSHSNSLLYSLSLLKERVHQVQSLVTILVSPHHHHNPPLSSSAAGMGTLIQEIIITASSMMFTCQQMSLGPQTGGGGAPVSKQINGGEAKRETTQVQNQIQNQTQSFYSNEMLENWYAAADNSYNTTAAGGNCNENGEEENNDNNSEGGGNCEEGGVLLGNKDYDIVEMDAADLLAKYTHYCHVCGKGFKRDANLRMHMRAHGDEYKSSAALINPMKHRIGGGGDDLKMLPRKYSCPQEGCRWNKKHAKFQPLKSMICVKNHYKRSHCPKMYVCKRCNGKNFSVLSDLRTHEKHCGDLRWQCSCGTTFSRKDKLMGHVALFVGHTPAIKSLMKMGKVAEWDEVEIMRVDKR